MGAPGVNGAPGEAGRDVSLTRGLDNQTQLCSTVHSFMSSAEFLLFQVSEQDGLFLHDICVLTIPAIENMKNYLGRGVGDGSLKHVSENEPGKF